MLKQFILSLVVLFSVGAVADEGNFNPLIGDPPGGPGGFLPPGATLLVDCPEGPGWIRLTTVDYYGYKQYKQVYLGGGVKGCEAQADLLRKTRAVIRVPSVVALCSPKPSYMVRWVISPNGYFNPTPQTYFGEPARCLDAAVKLNSQPQ